MSDLMNQYLVVAVFCVLVILAGNDDIMMQKLEKKQHKEQIHWISVFLYKKLMHISPPPPLRNYPVCLKCSLRQSEGYNSALGKCDELRWCHA